MKFRTFFILITIFSLCAATEGCSGKKKDKLLSTGIGTGSGTGNGTGTGTGTYSGDGTGIELVCVYDPELGAQTSHKEHFGSIVQESSGYIWTGTKNQVFISKATIKDGISGDVIIMNLDDYMVRGGGLYGYSEGTTIYVGGDCLTLTFQHELGHAKMSLKDHYGSMITCIMNASNNGAYMGQRNYCEGGMYDCWGAVVSKFNISPDGATGTVPPTEIVIQ
ncbi:MAG: hypothetical protein E3J72_11420 [Planctomycetota bacterium]|nr:MAG: hypothetical protein E3J72_11420 [Planctomycetota bacterium]